LYFALQFMQRVSQVLRRKGLGDVTKEALVELIRKLLRPNQELDFLMKLDSEELKALAACIRNGLEPKKK
jgi:hypothetical protein